ncbi:unnamed protein product (macronuclear) [Paramecium tetraurelia]|uniref:Uncharacterized protein n=1 Tax=Paramecium tetraurelia TaxID=5888 RepID=A0EFC8_PARTE|nr:uncharacterized protein GSPATT00026342001 [Paramecium tetraurelia]CAK94019.1 unnamed protein product [Paramecium tetraurelia]|eukprot:XP_001461392.1 hypothetical protein (macronuclear) [Paramecium tetraurelia strain d4-2]
MQEQEIDLTKINQGNVDRIIQKIETSIQQRVEKYGDDDQQVYNLHLKLLQKMKYDRILCKLLNQQALIALQVENFEASLKYLKKAELLTSSVLELKAQTYSNLACYYRKIGKTRTALSYLQQALAIELKNDKSAQLPELYLNLCAVFSSLERHEEATQNIYLSIIMLQHELLLQFLKSNSQIDGDLMKHQNSIDLSLHQISTQQKTRQTEQNSLNKDQQERMQILIVAYHNLGVEMEHLKQNVESKKILKSAYQLSQFSLAQNHPLRQTLGSIVKKHQREDSKDNFQPVVLKPILPKVSLRIQDPRQVQKSGSPHFKSNSKHFSLPKNKSNKGSKEDRNSSSLTSRIEGSKFVRISDLNQEPMVYFDNKEVNNLKELQISLDMINQTTMM